MTETNNTPPAQPLETGPRGPESVETEEQRIAREAQERRRTEQQALEERTRAARDVTRRGLPEQVPVSSRPALEQARPESLPSQQHPQGWMERMGQTLEGFWGKTKSGSQFAWKKTLDGFSATADWFVKMWDKIETSFGKVRAGLAVAFGGLVAKMDKILPQKVKDIFNAIVGNYGVFYATLNRLGVKVTEGAQQAIQDAGEQINAGVDRFAEIYEQAKAWGNTTLDFPGFIREVAVRLRVLHPNLQFTMAEMVAMATTVAGTKMVAIPATVPAGAPARPETSAPQQAQTFETLPVGTNLLGSPVKLRFENQDLTVQASREGTIKVNDVTYKLTVRKFIGVGTVGVTQWVAPSLQELEWQADGLHCTGTLILSESQVVPRSVLEDFLRRHLRGERQFENEKVSLQRIP